MGIDDYITTPKRIEALVHHDISRMEHEAGSLWRFMECTMISEADVTILVRKVEREVEGHRRVGPEPHAHQVSQYYCLLDPLILEVSMGSEIRTVTGPATIMVPACTTHSIRFLGGEGYLVNVLRQNRYE